MFVDSTGGSGRESKEVACLLFPATVMVIQHSSPVHFPDPSLTLCPARLPLLYATTREAGSTASWLSHYQLAQERYKTTNILAYGVQAKKSPRMCWSGCSLLVDDLKAAVALLSSVVVEASCQRQTRRRLHYRLGRTMHAPCMFRLTLADVWRRQPESHESFELACRNAAGRCSTSASM